MFQSKSPVSSRRRWSFRCSPQNHSQGACCDSTNQLASGKILWLKLTNPGRCVNTSCTLSPAWALMGVSAAPMPTLPASVKAKDARSSAVMCTGRLPRPNGCSVEVRSGREEEKKEVLLRQSVALLAPKAKEEREEVTGQRGVCGGELCGSARFWWVAAGRGTYGQTQAPRPRSTD